VHCLHRGIYIGIEFACFWYIAYARYYISLPACQLMDMSIGIVSGRKSLSVERLRPHMDNLRVRVDQVRLRCRRSPGLMIRNSELIILFLVKRGVTCARCFDSAIIAILRLNQRKIKELYLT
jgi:hypothetical protein